MYGSRKASGAVIGDCIKTSAGELNFSLFVDSDLQHSCTCIEYADYYRVGALKKTHEGPIMFPAGPPWRTDVPDLETYAWRGARQLDTRCYKGKCFQCKWAAMANTTIEYNWGKTQKHRFESFCYGPKNCRFYKMGKPRAVSYKGMGTFYDEGWLDEICTENRDDEE